MDRSAFIRGLLDDPRDPQLPQGVYGSGVDFNPLMDMVAGMAVQPYSNEPGRRLSSAPGRMNAAMVGFPGFAKDMAQGMAHSAKNFGTIFGDAYTGKFDPMSDEGIARAFDAAGFMTGSALPYPKPAGAVGMGGGGLLGNGLTKGAVVDDLAGAFAPSNAPVRGQTSKELVAMRAGVLSDDEANKLESIFQKNPGFRDTAKFLTPQELQTVISNPRQIEAMNRLLEVLPSASQFASMAKAGAPKLGWYRGSTQALLDVFGKEDAPRFAAMLAATSPQTSVESNLTNALHIWKNWNAAGRPTDPKAIKSVMGRSVQGNKGEDSVLDAWVNNTIAALGADDPLKTVLSGPKVDSFFRNLADDVYRVTNDAWISNASGIDQGLLRVSPSPDQLLRGNPGLSPGYLALNARQRAGGQMANMLPAEAQETGWSVAMPLMEMQTSTGIPARDILQKGLLTPDIIKGTPDFRTLLTQEKYAQPLIDAGYGSQVSGLTAHDAPFALPELTTGDQNNLMRLGRTLEDLGQIRGRERRATLGWKPSVEPRRTATNYQQMETAPGPETGHFEDAYNAMEPGSRNNFSSRKLSILRDHQGHDIVNRLLGLDTMPTQQMSGAFKDPTTGAYQLNRGNSAPSEVPLTARGQVKEDVQNRMRFSNYLKQLVLAQHGVTNITQIPSEAGANIAVGSGSKLRPNQVQGLLGDVSPAPWSDEAGPIRPHGAQDHAIVDTGSGAYILNWGGKPGQEITDAAGARAARLISGEPNKKTKEFIPGKPDFMRTKSAIDDSTAYDDFGDLLNKANEGQGLVTDKVLQAYDQLRGPAQRAMNSEDFRKMMDDLYQFDESQLKKFKGGAREDIMRVIDNLRRGGVEELRRARQRGEKLASIPGLLSG